MQEAMMQKLAERLDAKDLNQFAYMYYLSSQLEYWRSTLTKEEYIKKTDAIFEQAKMILPEIYETCMKTKKERTF